MVDDLLSNVLTENFHAELEHFCLVKSNVPNDFLFGFLATKHITHADDVVHIVEIALALTFTLKELISVIGRDLLLQLVQIRLALKKRSYQVILSQTHYEIPKI